MLSLDFKNKNLSLQNNLYVYNLKYAITNSLPYLNFKIIFLLDLSDSMKFYLEKSIKGLQDFILNLPDSQEFCIIGFSDNIKQLTPFINKTNYFKNYNLSNIETGAGTNLYKALNYLNDNYIDKDCIYHIVLITDGYPTDENGNLFKDFTLIYDLAYKLLNRGFSLSAISLLNPLYYKQDFLFNLGDILRGNFYYIREMTNLSNLLIQHIDILNKIVYKNLFLYFDLNNEVEIQSFIRVIPSIIEFKKIISPINLGFVSFNIDYHYFFLFKLKQNFNVDDFIFKYKLITDNNEIISKKVYFKDLLPYTKLDKQTFSLYLKYNLYRNTKYIQDLNKKSEKDKVLKLVSVNKEISKLLNESNLTKKIEIIEEKIKGDKIQEATLDITDLFSETKNTQQIYFK